MPSYEFKVTLSGTGDNEQEAWEDAIDHFLDDPGDPNGELTGFDDDDYYTDNDYYDEDDERPGHS